MLSVNGLVTGYGRLPVLEDVSIEARSGEMVTIVGANGAGKSTLLNAIAGSIRTWSGSVTLEGEDITRLHAHKRVRKGLVLVPEGRRLFMSMSVDENLALGAYCQRGSGAKARVAQERDRVFELFPVLGERTRQAAGTLSGGEQQMLAVGRALMARPRLLLLDEPSLGLAPKVIAEIFTVLDRLKSEGLTIVLVEQDAVVALEHADRGYVMRTGRVALGGSAEELAANDDVRLIYLGEWHGDG